MNDPPKCSHGRERVPDHQGTGGWECSEECKKECCPPVSIKEGVLYGGGGKVLMVHGVSVFEEKKAA